MTSNGKVQCALYRTQEMVPMMLSAAEGDKRQSIEKPAEIVVYVPADKVRAIDAQDAPADLLCRSASVRDRLNEGRATPNSQSHRLGGPIIAAETPRMQSRSVIGEFWLAIPNATEFRAANSLSNHPLPPPPRCVLYPHRDIPNPESPWPNPPPASSASPAAP